MHELSIALSIIDVASEEAERRTGERIAAVHLKLGALSGVVKPALMSAFELAREGSPLADSALIIEDVPVSIWCERCEAEALAVAPNELRCRICGEPGSRIIAGQELEVVALELETYEHAPG